MIVECMIYPGLATTALAAGLTNAVALGTLLLGTDVDESATADRTAGHGTARCIIGGISAWFRCVLHGIPRWGMDHPSRIRPALLLLAANLVGTGQFLQGHDHPLG